MTKREQVFTKTVWDYYRRHGRRSLPWRRTRDPYKILVSEIMLQQTQVERVIPKYKEFIKQWGSAAALAAAPLGDVLRAWQGLGYNRRAKMLRDAAMIVAQERGGILPASYEELRALPGVGSYTAGAVMAFAYNRSVPVIETNIRTVYIYHFFSKHEGVSDQMLVPLITNTLDDNNPREWYWALMDYGAYLKREHGNLNTKSKQYTKQSRFLGSNRQIRGAIVRVLSQRKHGIKTSDVLVNLPTYAEEHVLAQIVALEHDGLVRRTRDRIRLP